MASSLDRARGSFQQCAWGDAYSQLSTADREAPLEVEDVERLAVSAHMLGKDSASADAWARAYHAWLGAGETLRGSRCASWLSFTLLLTGEGARSAGWLTRAQGLLAKSSQDCVEQGYVLLPDAVRRLHQGDVSTSFTLFERIAGIGERFADRDLTTFGRLGMGQSLIRLGKTADGMALLDEAMVAVTADELSPIAVGTVYCAVIEACQAVFDLDRAREWTTALNSWCNAQEDLVPYRHQCLVHRAEIMQLHGAWPEAMEEARRASAMLSRAAALSAAGAAFYQQGELHRLRGDFEDAEEAYRNAKQRGREPQPGLALLRLAQGQVEGAATAIRLVMDQTTDRVEKCKLLPACVEIMLAANDFSAARRAADELLDIAQSIDAPLLHAHSAHMIGAVLLGEGDARAALTQLRHAWAAWQKLEAPYEAARVRLLVGLACSELGDKDTAEMELDAALWVFQELGAGHDVARVEALSRSKANQGVGGLTGRELQVLRLVAGGKTNQAIADELFLSEHTIRRHVQNIFAKLDVSSRAAATAFAFQHDLI